jgi:uncharacterized phage protein gp47/JayE
MASFGVKYFETIAGSIMSFFAGNNSALTDYNVGSRLRTIFEAVAIELEQIYYQIFVGVSDGIKTAVYDSFSFPLLQSRAASGLVRFSRNTPAPVGGVTIPSGTQVATSGSTTAPSVAYQTVDTVIILEGATYIDALVVATTDGAVGNAIANTVINLIGSPSGVNSATNPAAFFTGRDIETDSERQSRFQRYIANLSRSTIGAIENAALTVENVVDAVAFESPKLAVYVYSAITTLFTDISFEANLPSGSPQRALPATISYGDNLYVGSSGRFDVLQFILDAGRVGGAATWEYWNGAEWTALSYISDSTSRLLTSGTLAFNKPANWRDVTVNGSRKYWVRLNITSPSISQAPKIIEVKASPLPGVVNLVAMDSTAALSASLRTSVMNAVELYRAAGIRVSVFGPTTTNVDVTVTITADPLADAEALEASVTQAIIDYISSFSLGRKIVLSELIQLIENQSTDIEETILVAPTDRIDTSFDEVLRPGTVTVTVLQ